MRGPAIQDEREQDGALENYPDRFVAELLHRVKAVSQQRRIRGEDHEDEARDEQVAEAERDHERNQKHKAHGGHHEPQRHHVAQVALDLAVVARALADEKNVEAEVQNHADDRGQVDEHGEGPVARRTQPPDHVEHGHQRDQARDDLGCEHDDRVAEGSRAEPQARDRLF